MINHQSLVYVLSALVVLFGFWKIVAGHFGYLKTPRYDDIDMVAGILIIIGGVLLLV